MPYVYRRIFIRDKVPAYLYLHREHGYTLSKSQSLLDKGYIRKTDGTICRKNDALLGEYEMLVYEPRPRGIDIVHESDDFVVIDKDSFVLTHPNGRHCEYSLCDDLWARWGRECAVAHRLDYETSGLLCAGKSSASSAALKQCFAQSRVQKLYLALVHGDYAQMMRALGKSFVIDVPLGLSGSADDFVNKMTPHSPKSKPSTTHFTLLGGFDEMLCGEFDGRINSVFDEMLCSAFDTTNEISLDDKSVAITTTAPTNEISLVGKFAQPSRKMTLVLARPITGRQHQIRAHLYYAGYPIVGDTIYGFTKSQTQRHLDGLMSASERMRLSGASRLCLHASALRFEYGGEIFDLRSAKDALGEFLRATRGE